MFSPLAYFALTEVKDPSRLQHENDLHLLYHRPQLLQLPDVAWGERWMLEADCAGESVYTPEFALHYAAMYWLREPRHQSARALTAHFARAEQLGLGSSWARSAFDEFLVPLKGYVRHDRLVSDEALPFRPMRGAYLMVSRFFRHQDVAAEATFHWYDQVRIPDMLDCAGAAGAWTFASRELFSPTGDLSKPIIRINLFYVDGDPVSFGRDLAERRKVWERTGRSRDTRDVEEVLFAGPLRIAKPFSTGRFATSRQDER
jgi:hypothetical protein